jgi:hypothetical protein
MGGGWGPRWEELRNGSNAFMQGAVAGRKGVYQD